MSLCEQDIQHLSIINYIYVKSLYYSLRKTYAIVHRNVPMTVNGRTDPSTCHCLLNICHSDFLLSIADDRSTGARPHKSWQGFIAPVDRM